MNSALFLQWQQACLQFSAPADLVRELWDEIETAYLDPSRHYHNLDHIDMILAVLKQVRQEITNWEATVFAAFYHDMIYDTLRKDNEAASAELAEKRLSSMKIPAATIEACLRHILATRNHKAGVGDTNYFTDADLSILGSSPADYTVYAGKIRMEYAHYATDIYNSGRISVLQNFLEMDTIFKTRTFHNEYEQQARENITSELKLLMTTSNPII